MNTNYEDNNHLRLVGKVTSEKRFSHEIYGEKFYIFDLSVARLSGNADIIPVTISERLLTNQDLAIGTNLQIDGQFRSYNSYDNEKNRLILTVFVKDIQFLEENEEDEEARRENVSNEVILDGYICKKPIYRKTPFGREISDILLAVNRAYNKSDYIPCIAWGRNARFCENVAVGTEVRIIGRVQSREYEKKYEDGTVEKRVAYEVSVSSLEIANQDGNEEEEKEVHDDTRLACRPGQHLGEAAGGDACDCQHGLDTDENGGGKPETEGVHVLYLIHSETSHSKSRSRQP